MTTNLDAVLVDGPSDQSLVTAGAAALVEVASEGLIHRYIRTTQQRHHDGAELTVYTYDGAVRADGGESGAENAADRVASPLADGRATPLPAGQVEGTSSAGRS
jgi:hypothetical protein